MQEKSDLNTGQSSTARRKKSSEGSEAGASASSTTAGASGSGVMDQAKKAITNVAGQASDKVTSTLDTQKDRAAEGIDSIAQALRQTSDQLSEKNQAVPVHEYLSSAAEQVERLSGYLRSADIKQIVSQVEQFARRQPAIFLGGAFVLGMLGARFLKSSGQIDSAGSALMRRGESYTPPDTFTSAQSFGQSSQTGATQQSMPLGTAPIQRREDL